MTESQQLLADYAGNGSEAAFRQLVARYIDLVYSTALRRVHGDTHRAEDVAQVVFADLARQARKLSKDTMLGGWLHHHTLLVAATVMRSEQRRQIRERLAMEIQNSPDHTPANLAELGPQLDDAIDRLGTDDRAAILLRFFEQLDFQSVAARLGTTEEAARKRVSRALDKLHNLVRRRGVTLSAAVLGTALATNAVSAAPAGLAGSVATAALAGSAAVTTSLTLLKITGMTKLQFGATAALLLAGAATPWLFEHQAQARLRQDYAALRQKADQLSAENERLAALAGKAAHATDLPPEQPNELLRLRGEVGVLRRQAADADRLRTENRRLQAAVATPAPNPHAAEDAIPFSNPVPRESWAFAGYATPEAAVQSMVWAWSNRDPDTVMASFTPEGWNSFAKDFEGKSAAEAIRSFPVDISKASSYRIKQTEVSDEKVNLVLAFDLPFSMGYSRDFTLKRIGTEWKAE